MNISLVIIFVFLAFAIFLGIRARRGKDMSLEQWSVGGRDFGTLFVFLLLAGEIYTTFTFLGGSGWAYGEGGPAFYILAYGCLAYIISYWLLPAIWRYAKEHRLHSQSDFFTKKYESKGLGVLVSLVAVVAMVPYLSLQFKGLGLIVSEASYGAISSTVAIIIGVAAVTAYTSISGIHGSAWTAVLKDIMVLVVVVFMGLYLPFVFHGGIGDMFREINAQKPDFLTLPNEGYSPAWFVSTVMLTALGFFMWPHYFTSAFSAENERIFKRNAIFMPLYQLVLLFVFFVGFAALLQVPGLEGSAVDLSLLRVSKEAFGPVLLGLIGAAGVLTALVPGSIIMMVSATVLAKNVYRVFAPSTSERTTGTLARLLVPAVALVALVFTLNSGDTIVILLLLGYSLVTQLFPALIFSLTPNNFVTKWGAGAGILAGVSTVTYVTITETTIGQLLPFLPQSVADTNIGIIALFVNFVVLLAVSFATGGLAVRREQSA
ncbi:MAG TPA: sodium:solute symporter family protein [Rubrobacteraceae bacterium]|nr:sodium:solute symporter family protein [Rubrobacteraceae bacterium]